MFNHKHMICYHFKSRRYMAEILPIRHKTLSNQSILNFLMYKAFKTNK